MRKLFTFLALFIGALTAGATDFTDTLVVTVNGVSSGQHATISLAQADNGTYTFSLNNFVLQSEGQTMPVGTILLEGVEGTTDADGILHLATNQAITIQAGDMEGVTMWLGPMLGNVPIDMTAETRGDKLHTSIDIDMQSMLGQTIHVEFGEKFPTTYTDTLVVTVNGVSTGQNASISLKQNLDNTYTFSLNNFILQSEGATMPVGTILLSGIEGTTDADGVLSIATKQAITIQAGDMEGVAMWLGPMLGNVPIDMRAEIRGSKLYTVIDIDMQSMLGQTIKVVFGDGGYQLPNSGFENFYTTTSKISSGEVEVQEPVSWHSFATVGGDLAAYANTFSSNAHTFVSSETRPGSAGSHSVLVVASSAMGIVANGTITTGRMNAGAISPADTKNHAETDTSKTELDPNGDPYYATVNGRPDSLVVWLKYKQGTASEAHPYATVSAAITDGTYYQDPQDKEYTNVIATAKNAKIESNGFEWQRVAIPFEYTGSTAKGGVVLVTISTNADAGQANANDTLYVDDAQLIYNASIAAATVRGVSVAIEPGVSTYAVKVPQGSEAITADDIVVTSDGNGAKVTTEITSQDNDTTVATVTVASNDLQQVNTFTLNITTDTSVVGIGSTKANDGADKVKAVYDIMGRKVSTLSRGGIYIIVYESGKTEKVAR